MNDTANEIRPPVDLTELGEMCGCTEKQVRFAEGLLQGMNFSEAAFRAGYAGDRDSVQIRSAGSTAARAKPVQALLALAESRGLGVSDAPGDREELIRILWSHARSKDKAHSIKASAELNRLMEADTRAKEAEEIQNIEATLDEIAEISPEIALHLATKKKIDWQPGPSVQDQVQAARRAIAIAYLNEQKPEVQNV